MKQVYYIGFFKKDQQKQTWRRRKSIKRIIIVNDTWAGQVVFVGVCVTCVRVFFF